MELYDRPDEQLISCSVYYVSNTKGTDTDEARKYESKSHELYHSETLPMP